MGSASVLTVATPPTRVPVSVSPSISKSTWPVGVPLPGGTGATVAVKTAVSPKAEGSGAETTVVVVVAWPTVCVSAPAEPRWQASPP
nr:hypothetical protein [Streptomyces sp. S07_1.15]